MSEPYYTAKSGDPILADTWNNMQIKTRDEIRSHTHRGGDDGQLLDGTSISPTASLKVNKVEATLGLTVKNVDISKWMDDTEAKKLSLTGGNLSGPFSVMANVGIGAAPSTRRLLVQGAVDNNAAVEIRSSGNNAWGVGLIVKTTGATEGAALQLRSRNKSWLLKGELGATAEGFQISEGGGDGENGSGYGTPRLHLKAGGSMGLNTTDPQGALDIRLSSAAAGFDRLVVNTTTLWGNGQPQVTIGAGGAAGLMINNPHVVWNSTDNRASIRYGLSGGVATGLMWDVGARASNAFSFMVNNTHSMWMGADGSVGIGTSTPGVRLDVQGGSLRVSGAIMPSIGNAPGNGIQFPLDAFGGTGDSASIRYYRAPNPLPGEEENGKLVISCENEPGDAIILNQGGADRMTLVNANVGIGTSRPGTPLHIAQREANLGIRLTEHVSGRFVDIAYTGTGILQFAHSNGAGQSLMPNGQWLQISDAGLKQNIASLEGVLPRVLALRPVSYELKATGHPQLGLVAQEVEPLFPELVADSPRMKDDGEPFKGLTYESFSVLAIAALKELKQQYDERIAALEQRLQEQERKS
ncbi:tail fiber domain-containing protein [Myxococcus stipitatus]|uniref:tail fiber domain-containing protein n=1 Tax=Myxococcus stipitatus TaxID=83455 RepID=UPI003144F786